MRNQETLVFALQEVGTERSYEVSVFSYVVQDTEGGEGGRESSVGILCLVLEEAAFRCRL